MDNISDDEKFSKWLWTMLEHEARAIEEWSNASENTLPKEFFQDSDTDAWEQIEKTIEKKRNSK